MTEEERTKFKAEIVAELGQHLDEHYMKIPDAGNVVASFLELLGVGSMDDRLRQVEMLLAVQDIHRGVDVTDGQKWMWVATVRDDYAKKVRRSIVKWFKENRDDNIPDELKIHIDALDELFRLLDPD